MVDKKIEKKEESQEDKTRKQIKTGVSLFFVAMGLILVLILIFSCFYTVSSGEKAILLTFGKASLDTKDEGLHFKLPFVQKVIKYETRTLKYEADASAASKDLQIVTAKVVTNYHIIPEDVAKIFTSLGVNYAERVIQPMEQEVVKSITSKYTAEELITKREEVRIDIKNVLVERLRERSIVVEEVSITNFDFSVSFNQAIEQKVTSVQLKLKALNDLERIKVEAEQKVTSATAEATALRLQKQEITPDLIRLREIENQRIAIEKWNGVLPQVTGSNGMPLVNLDNIKQ